MIGKILKKVVAKKGNGKVIALLNQKGGVGKTTMAFNLAHALKEKGKRVLCLDMDPQANLGILFGYLDKVPGDLSRFNLFHLLINQVRDLKALHSPCMLSDVLIEAEDENGIDYIPAGQELSGFELSVAAINSPRQLILRKFLEQNDLYSRYDHIIIDGPPTLGLLVVNILTAAHGVLIPFQPDQFSRQGLIHFHEVLAEISEMGVGEAPVILGHIPNLVDLRRKQSRDDFTLIQEELADFKVFPPIPNKVQLVKSSAQGKSIFAYKTAEFLDLKKNFIGMAEHIIKEL
jgi:chromosome partitioning protein